MCDNESAFSLLIMCEPKILLPCRKSIQKENQNAVISEKFALRGRNYYCL